MSEDGSEREGQEVLDLRGLRCPLPALRTRKALAALPVGRKIDVHCTDPLAVLDIPHLVGETGDELVETVRTGREIRFRIRKGRGREDG